MNALRWVILLAVIAVAGLFAYLATSDPAERSDPVHADRPGFDPDRPASLDRHPAGEAAASTFRAALEIRLPDGDAAPHAAIEIRGPVAASLEADTDGRASVDGLPPGRYDLVATSGRATGAMRFEIVDADVDLGTLRLVAGVLIRGTVFGAEGEPAAGALVESVDAANAGRALEMTALLERMVLPDRVVSHARTGGDGAYSLTVPHGSRVQLRASLSGHAQEGYPARSFGSDVEGVDFHLMTGAPIAGRVTGPGGEPVAGAQVLAVNPIAVFGSGLPKCETRSDAAGRFELSPGPADQLMLLVHAAGYAMYANQNLRPPVLDLAVELERGFTLKLRTVDKDDPTRAAADVDVMVVYGGGLEIGRTNERGELLLDHVSATDTSGGFGGTQSAMFWGAGYVPHQMDLDDREPVDGLLDIGDVALDAGGIVRGRVTDAETGKPIDGAKVRSIGGLDQQMGPVGAVPATTGADGRYELRGVPLGAVAVIATHEAYQFDPQILMRSFGNAPGGTSIFEEGEREAKRDLTLTRARILRGKVVSPDDRPVAGARVSAGDSSGMLITMFLGGASPVVFTGSDGTFELIAPTALPMMGAPELTASHRDFGPSDPIPLSKAPEGEIVLRLQEPHVVRGKVVDSEGEPVPAVRVRAAPKPKDPAATQGEAIFEPLSRQSTTTNAEGGFELRNTPSGEVELHFEHPQYVPGKLEIFIDRRTGSTDAPLFTILRGERITGVVVGPGGEPAAGVHVFASFSGAWGKAEDGRTWGNATTDQEGSFVLGGLRAGLFRVQLNSPGHYCRETDVSTGSKEVRLVLVKAADLTGRVISRGAPVAGAWVQAKMLLKPATGEIESWDHLDSKRTDARGEFRLTELPPDRPVRITIRHDLYRNAEFDDVVPDGQVKTFHLQKGQQVSGIVVDEQSRPIANVQVEVKDGDHAESIRTAEDGTFRVGGLGSERIVLKTLESDLDLVPGDEVEVPGGARNVRLVAARGLRIEGRFLGLDAIVTTWASIEVLGARGETVQTGFVDTDTGAFSIRGVRAGTYTLRLMTYAPSNSDADTYEERQLAVFEGIAAGTTGLELTLPR